MTTYFVPIERKALAACDPRRWFIVTVECATPVEAMAQAKQAIIDMRLGQWVLWAAVRQCPSFRDMQRLRDGMDAARFGGRA